MLAGTRTIVPELCSVMGGSLKQNSVRRLATSARAALENASSSSPASSSASTTSSVYGRVRNTTPIKSPVTPEKASEYLTSLLSLPSSRPFPAPLALRILTHKSYRGVQVLGQGYNSRTSSPSGPTDSLTEAPGSATHNARLTFLGKRAMLSYLLMFIHQHALDTGRPIGTELQALSLLNTKGEDVGLEEKLQNLVNLSNLGRTVGSRWGLEHVMRWQSNLTGESAQGRDSGALKIYGEGVQAVIGGTMMQYGSPAAHRLFHLQVLPTLAPQLKDPALVEAVDKVRSKVMKEMSGEKCVFA